MSPTALARIYLPAGSLWLLTHDEEFLSTYSDTYLAFWRCLVSFVREYLQFWTRCILFSIQSVLRNALTIFLTPASILIYSTGVHNTEFLDKSCKPSCKLQESILLNIMFHAPIGRFQLELIYYFIYFSALVPYNICVLFSCRPFVVNTTFSTGLVGVEVTSVSWLGQLTELLWVLKLLLSPGLGSWQNCCGCWSYFWMSGSTLVSCRRCPWSLGPRS